MARALRITLRRGGRRVAFCQGRGYLRQAIGIAHEDHGRLQRQVSALGAEAMRGACCPRNSIAGLQEPSFFLARGNERVEARGGFAIGATSGRPMNELVLAFNEAGVRYLLVGGQAMRLTGMPRFSMDWDFYIPPRDEANMAKLNAILADELDAPLVPLGKQGENFIQTYQTRWGVLQFHLGLPGVPRFDEAEATAAIRRTETGTPVKCLSAAGMLAAKRAAGRPQDQADIAFLEELQRLGKL